MQVPPSPPLIPFRQSLTSFKERQMRRENKTTPAINYTICQFVQLERDTPTPLLTLNGLLFLWRHGPDIVHSSGNLHQPKDASTIRTDVAIVVILARKSPPNAHPRRMMHMASLLFIWHWDVLHTGAQTNNFRKKRNPFSIFPGVL